MIDVLPDQVFHHHVRMALTVAQRPADNCPNMLFELVYRTAVLCPVAGIMHSWRDFVDDQAL